MEEGRALKGRSKWGKSVCHCIMTQRCGEWFLYNHVYQVTKMFYFIPILANTQYNFSILWKYCNLWTFTTQKLLSGCIHVVCLQYLLNMQCMGSLCILFATISELQVELKQLERLRSEIPPAAPWLPILVICIRSQVKKRQSQSYKFKKLPKIEIFKFCKKLYMQHTFWSCLIRCINMKWILPEL